MRGTLRKSNIIFNILISYIHEHKRCNMKSHCKYAEVNINSLSFFYLPDIPQKSYKKDSI